MTTLYLDHDSYPAYALTPTWGMPQDGDGVGTAISTASATVSIDMSAATAATGNTLAIMGCVLTADAALGDGVFATGSGATLVANLVACINRTNSTKTITAQATGWGTPKLQDAVFARVGTPTTTLEIMTRCGSAQYNSSQITSSGITGLSSPYTFSGGASGCWGYLHNVSATLWPSAIAAKGYGLFSSAKFTAGVFNAGDELVVRSGKTLAYSGSTTVNIAGAYVGTVTAPLYVTFDDGSVWTDTEPVTACTFSGNYFTIYVNGAAYLVTTAPKYASGQRGLVFDLIGSADYAYITTGTARTFVNMDFKKTGGVIGWVITTGGGSVLSASALFVLKGCRFLNSNVSTYIVTGVSNYYRFFVKLIDCTIEITNPVTAGTQCISMFNSATYAQVIELDACKFVGFAAGSRLLAATVRTGTAQVITLKDCDMGNVTTLGPNYLATAGRSLPGTDGFYMTDSFGLHQFVMDVPGCFYAEWVQANGYPTLNARLPDGLTPWSIYAVPCSTAANITKLGYVELPRLTKLLPTAVDLPEAVRTFTLNFLLESTLGWTKADISVAIKYIGTDNVVHTYDSFAEAALDTSSAAWTATSWRGQTWLPKQFSLTTPEVVKAGTEVAIYIRIHTTTTPDTKAIIICPEVLIA